MIERLREAKERRDAEKLQKKLIKTEDDKIVVEALPADEDNSGINFPEVVRSMEAPYVAKVVEKTEEELQEEGKIKNAIMATKDNGVKLDLTQQYLEFLTKWDVVDIFGTLSPVKETKKSKKKAEENAEEKPKEESEEKAEENAEEKPKGESEQKVEEKNPIEEKKIEIISQIILNDFKKSGASWNIKELTDFLEERSKLSVLNITLTNIAGLMNERN